MDFLNKVFEKQVALQERITIDDSTVIKLMTSNNIIDREKISSWNILAMHAELSELLEWTNWKIHKKTRTIYTPEILKEIHIELIDLLHFWINLCIIWNFTPEMIVELFNEKNNENHARQDRKY